MRPAGSSRSPAEREHSSRRPAEVAFEPVRLGRRRGRPDRAVVAALAVVAVVAVAVVKPWEIEDGSPGGGASAAPPAADAGAAVSPDPAASGRPQPKSVPGERVADWDQVAAAIRPHDGWGVRALVDTPDIHRGIKPVHSTLTERWEPAVPAIDSGLGISMADGEASRDAVVLPTRGEVVRVLGITAPAARTPLDARVWWIRPDAEPRWLDVRSVDPAVAGAHLLLLPPRSSDGSAAVWPEGTYRVDLLLGADLTRLVVVLPTDRPVADSTPDPFDPGPVAEPALMDPRSADLGGLEPGPFVVAHGAAVSVQSALGPPQLEAATWLDAAPGPPGARTVAEVWLPETNGIGFVLPAGAQVEWAALVRLAPVDVMGVVAAARRFSDVRGTFTTVLFWLPDGRPWSAGTYALDVRWSEDGARREGRWHISLLPGPARRTGAWTSLARGWAGQAGDWGIVTGTAMPLGGGPSGAAIRFFAQQPGTVLPDPAALGERCAGGALVDASGPVVGIAHAVDRPVRSVRVERWFVGGRRLALPVSAAPNVVPGLSIVGPSAEVPWPPGYYRLVVETVGADARLTVCLGEVGRSGSRAYPATASAEAYVAAKAGSTTR